MSDGLSRARAARTARLRRARWRHQLGMADAERLTLRGPTRPRRTVEAVAVIDDDEAAGLRRLRPAQRRLADDAEPAPAQPSRDAHVRRARSRHRPASARRWSNRAAPRSSRANHRDGGLRGDFKIGKLELARNLHGPAVLGGRVTEDEFGIALARHRLTRPAFRSLRGDSESSSIPTRQMIRRFPRQSRRPRRVASGVPGGSKTARRHRHGAHHAMKLRVRVRRARRHGRRNRPVRQSRAGRLTRSGRRRAGTRRSAAKVTSAWWAPIARDVTR